MSVIGNKIASVAPRSSRLQKRFFGTLFRIEKDTTNRLQFLSIFIKLNVPEQFQPLFLARYCPSSLTCRYTDLGFVGHGAFENYKVEMCVSWLKHNYQKFSRNWDEVVVIELWLRSRIPGRNNYVKLSDYVNICP